MTTATKRPRMPGIVQWFGGKGRMLGRLRPLIPQTHVYAEAYGGAGSVLFDREPSPVEAFNDLNDDLVTVLRVLQNKRSAAELQHRLALTAYSRQEFREALRILDDPGASSRVNKAWAFIVAHDQGFAGHARVDGDWGRSLTGSGCGMARQVAAWMGRIHKHLPNQIARIQRVQIDSVDALQFIAFWDTEETTHYLDPPYMQSTRKGGGYKHETDDGHHEQLVALLLTLDGAVVLSGYEHAVYEPLIAAGWERIKFAGSCAAAGRTRNSGLQGQGAATKKVARTEVVWRNPKAVALAPYTAR
jgi:DNA adenine methylase